MSFLKRKFQQFSGTSYSLGILLLAAFILHLAPTLTGSFYADDYLQRTILLGSNALAEKGLLEGVEVGSLGYFLQHQFSFFSADFNNYEAMINAGILPWWSNDAAFMDFFRPLSALTHFIDYNLYPNNAHIMQLLSLLWYVLGLWIIYRLYEALGLSKRLALLSLLLVLADLSIFSSLSWIAARNMLLVVAFGFFTVYAYHKGVKNKYWYGASLLGLLASLLSAEAAIGICAYLGAYALAFDTRSAKIRFMYLLPFIVLTILWRLGYQQMGYGVAGIDLYIDPGQTPIAFLTRALWAYPANYFELVSGVDVMSGQLRADVREWLGVAGVAVFVLLTYVLRHDLKEERVLRFFYVASLLSLIPSLTVTIASRALFLPYVSMAVVFAYLLRALFQAKPRLGFTSVLSVYAVKLLCGYILLVHVLLSLLLTTVSLVSSFQPQEKSQGVIHGMSVTGIANKSVFVINSPTPYSLAYLPYEIDGMNSALPNSVRALATAYTDVTLHRISETTIQLVTSHAFQFDASTLIPHKNKRLPMAHAMYMTHELLGLNRTISLPWQRGIQRDFNDATIIVDELMRGKPYKISVILKQDISQYVWFDWDVNAKLYREISLPEVGGKLEFKGVFSVPE